MLVDREINRVVRSKPKNRKTRFILRADREVRCQLCFRIPEWAAGEMRVTVNGQDTPYEKDPKGFARIEGVWHEDEISVCVPSALRCYPLPDDPAMYAFVDGPVCLAGLVNEEHLLYGDPENSLLSVSDERQWQVWKTEWKTYHHRTDPQKLDRACDQAAERACSL